MEGGAWLRAEPAQAQWEAAPGRGPEQAGQHTKRESDWLLTGKGAGLSILEAAGSGGVLPRPLELHGRRGSTKQGGSAGSAMGE